MCEAEAECGASLIRGERRPRQSEPVSPWLQTTVGTEEKSVRAVGMTIDIAAASSY